MTRPASAEQPEAFYEVYGMSDGAPAAEHEDEAAAQHNGAVLEALSVTKAFGT